MIKAFQVFRRTRWLQKFRQVQLRKFAADSQNQVFDRKTKQMQRNFAASQEDHKVYEYVVEEIGYRLADRVSDILEYFPVAVDLGSGTGHLAPNLFNDNIGHLIQVEMAEEMLNRSKESPEVPITNLLADEETICFRDDSIDLFLSSLSSHWVNDLPGFFRRCYLALKQDGAFIAAIFGGDTLYELRCSLQLAEQERCGGVGNHVSPFVQVADIGSLMNRAGFKMLTLDSDDLVVAYPDMYSLMYDLQGMAQNSAAWSRSGHLRRDVALAASAIYQEMYGNEDGTIPATFQIIYVIGWKPGPKMSQPAARGSQNVSFKDLGKITSANFPTEEK